MDAENQSFTNFKNSMILIENYGFGKFVINPTFAENLGVGIENVLPKT